MKISYKDIEKKGIKIDHTGDLILSKNDIGFYNKINDVEYVGIKMIFGVSNSSFFRKTWVVWVVFLWVFFNYLPGDWTNFNDYFEVQAKDKKKL